MAPSCCHFLSRLAATQLGSQQPWLPCLKQGSLAPRLPARKIFSISAGGRFARVLVLLLKQVHRRTCEETGRFLPAKSIKQVGSPEIV